MTQLLLREVLKVGGLLRRVLDPHFAQFGLSAAQWGILRALARFEVDGNPAPHMYELGEVLLIQPPSLSATLDRMERSGFLSRVRCPNDQRTRKVVLTPAGRTLIAKVLVGHVAWQKTLVAGLSAAEQRQMLELLGRLGSRLEQANPALAAQHSTNRTRRAAANESGADGVSRRSGRKGKST